MSNDHDLLIEVATKVTTICKTMQEIKGEVKELKNGLPCKQMQKECGIQISKKVGWNVFIPIIVLIVGIVGSVFAYNFAEDSDAHRQVYRNSAVIEHLNKGVHDVDSDN